MNTSIVIPFSMFSIINLYDYMIMTLHWSHIYDTTLTEKD